MNKCKKLNLQGESVGEVAVDPIFEGVEASSQLLKDYIVAIRKNARQWSASTKTRSEVKHTTKKPHPQKKTGRARHGSLVGTQFRGGGIVFGPKPKFDQHVKINRKERRLAIRFMIAEKIKEGKVVVLEEPVMDAPKTKTLSQLLKATEFKGKTLFPGATQKEDVEENGVVKSMAVSSRQHENFAKSIQNIENTAFNLAGNVSGYDLAWAKNLVVSEKAMSELVEWLGAGKE